jgi:hypothetical protein
MGAAIAKMTSSLPAVFMENSCGGGAGTGGGGQEGGGGRRLISWLGCQLGSAWVVWQQQEKGARSRTLNSLYFATACAEWRLLTGDDMDKLAKGRAEAGRSREPRAIHPAANNAGTASRPTTPAQAPWGAAGLSGCDAGTT